MITKDEVDTKGEEVRTAEKESERLGKEWREMALTYAKQILGFTGDGQFVVELIGAPTRKHYRLEVTRAAMWTGDCIRLSGRAVLKSGEVSTTYRDVCIGSGLGEVILSDRNPR